MSCRGTYLGIRASLFLSLRGIDEADRAVVPWSVLSSVVGVDLPPYAGSGRHAPALLGGITACSAFVKNPCQIPAVVERIVRIRGGDIGEFHCAAY